MRAAVIFCPLVFAACSSRDPGPLDGSFRAIECDLLDCLDTEHMATGSRAQLHFTDYSRMDVTRAASTEPDVLAIGEPAVDGQFAIVDATATTSGVSTFQMFSRGTLIDQVDVVVEDVAVAAPFSWPKVVAGGNLAISGVKHGASGAKLFGRGGYALSAPGLTVTPAPLGSSACGLFVDRGADFLISGDTPGAFPLVASPVAADWSHTVTVVAPSDVVEVSGTGTWYGADGDYTARVAMFGIDVAGDTVSGVACTWTASRPVTITPGDCDGVNLASDRPTTVTLTCNFDGRVLGTVNVEPPPQF